MQRGPEGLSSGRGSASTQLPESGTSEGRRQVGYIITQGQGGHQGRGSRWPQLLLAPEASWPLVVAMVMVGPSSWARTL